MEVDLPQPLKSVAATIANCYQELQQLNSNIVHELLKGHEQFYEWDHYPKNDVQDKKTSCQYYYHSHPSADGERMKEHGHFHLFIRKPSIPKHLKPLHVSEKYKKDKSDNLCHLFAISMNEVGLPNGLFTVNHWVSQGLWYDAGAVSEMINLFKIEIDYPNKIVNKWLNAMVHLFNPTIKELLLKRDEIIHAWATQHPDKNVFIDKQLEITSLVEFQL